MMELVVSKYELYIKHITKFIVITTTILIHLLSELYLIW